MTTDLASELANVLCMPAGAAIDFSLVGRRYDGAGLKMVARHLRAGGIEVSTAPTRQFAAMYDAAVDRFVWPLGAVHPGVYELVIHEGLHAVQDMRCYPLLVEMAEAAAYLGGACWTLARRFGGAPSREDVRWAAEQVAHDDTPGRSIARAALEVILETELYLPGHVALGAADVAPLAAAIVAYPAYAPAAGGRFLTDGVFGQCWRCP